LNAESLARFREQSKYGLTGGTWGCPKCGYTLLNPMVSAELIVCPKCGFEPYPEVKKKTFYDMLYRIIARYKQEFPEEKIGESEDATA
jgi:rubredoxin